MIRTLPKRDPILEFSAYRFGEFVLQPSERLLTRAGALLPIQPKAFDALQFLLLHAGHLVSKEELMRSLWPRTHVAEASLTNVIVSLRKLLGRESIRTVSRHGYRFELPILGEPGIDRRTYEYFIEARTIIETRSLEKMPRARDLLSLCITNAPTFAQGWAWLGRSHLFLNKFRNHSTLGRELAKAALERALTLQPDSTDAHAVLTLHEVDSGHAAKAVVRLCHQLIGRPSQPELYAGLVHALRFRGLLAESLAAHRIARELDPTAPTSVAHTLFLAGDFGGCIEAYGGRTPYYLDAAAWASLGLFDRAARLLEQRIEHLPLSSLMKGLLESLLYAIQGRTVEAHQAITFTRDHFEPEILIYSARLYSYLGKGNEAALALEAARASGFVCAPEMLRNDPWLACLRKNARYKSLLNQSVLSVKGARKEHHKTLELLRL